MSEVYGACGAGLAGFAEPAVQSLTAEQVRAWVARWFVRENAALWVSGELPPGLELPLRSGAASARTPQSRRALATPAWTTMAMDGHVVLGAHQSRVAGAGAMLRILRDRAEDELRHRRGLSYDVTCERVPVQDDDRFVWLMVDVRDGQEPVAARLLWRLLEQLVIEGPTQDELAHDRSALAEYLADPLAAAAEVQAMAQASVTGVAVLDRDEVRAEAAAASAADIQAAAAAFRDAAVVALPESALLDLPGLERLPEWSDSVVSGRTFARRRGSEAPRGAQLVVGDDGVTLLVSPDERITMHWRDIVGIVQIGPEEWRLLGIDGLSFPLATADWKAGGEAVALIRSRVPVELQVTGDGAAPEGPAVLLLRAPAHVAREAVSLAGQAADMVTTPAWTVVRGADDAAVQAAAISGALGRKHWLLLLEEQHGELGYALFRGGSERDRHRWGAMRGDAALLRDAVGIPAADAAELLAWTGAADELLDRVVAALDLPAQVPAMLAGEPVDGLDHLPALGILAGLRASARGDFDPPEDTTGWDRRLAAWERRRTPWFRLVNAASAAVLGVVAWRTGSAAPDLVSWPAAFSLLAAAGAASSLWSTRPPARDTSTADVGS
jgi:hypothetical protein